MKDYRMIRDHKGILHKFKLKSWHHTKSKADEEAEKWKRKGYNIRIFEGKKLGKKIHKVYAFALWD